MDDPETIRDAAAGGAETAQALYLFGKIVVGTIVVLGSVWVSWIARDSILDAFNMFFARVGRLRLPSFERKPARSRPKPKAELPPPTSESLPPSWPALDFGAPVRWLLTRRLTAFFVAVVSLGIGVYLNAFHVVPVEYRERCGRGYRRYWHLTPDEAAAVLRRW